MLAQDRPSSPQVTKEEFQEFVRGWRNISSGKGSNDLRKYFTQVLELGGSEDSKCEVGFVFKDLAPMADSTGDVNPYRVAGAQPESLDTGIRGKLSKHIHPSNKHELIAPNFFLEVKAADGTSEMTLKGRVCYEGAIGARAMQTLRTYEQEKEQPVFDHNAYTISVTLHDGVLNLYTHHVTDGEPRRYTTIRVAEYPMRFGQEHFQKGITAYRNARDWAKKQRDELIVAANSREREGSRQQAAGSHVTPQDDATPDELGEKTQELDQGEAGTDATPEEDLAAPDELENGEKTQPSTTTAPASEPARSQGNVSGRKRRSDAGSEADRNKKARSI
ncbi:hypothetical protein N8T08_005054 [Aspergillus melleus]|uniref:Uncharacterized protein n=1 Tax=Aspergillus melleus TaxID=138277 RepID=A0ACC3BFJ5_9EURO|nr:hypothetical protein N8T08_005054 [Aspergillus melleus]